MKQREPTMPPEPHDQETWRLAFLLNGHWPWIMAGVLCLFVGLLRAYLDNVKITKRDFVESLICGIFVSVAKPVLGSMGVPDSFALFIGAASGLLGTRVLRPMLETLVSRFISRGGGK